MEVKKPEVECELNPNSPELYNKNADVEWRKMGFLNQADYEVHMRRVGDRKK